jgi:predicted nucleic acid-binding protein
VIVLDASAVIELLLRTPMPGIPRVAPVAAVRRAFRLFDERAHVAP